MMLSIVSLLVGAVLGLRFKIAVLVPAIAIVFVISIVAGLVQGYTGWSIVLMAAAGSASLQVGFIMGLVVQHVLEATSPSRPAPYSSTESARHLVR